MRKLFVSFISALTAIASTMTGAVGYATLNYPDPNGDGIISLLDAYYINLYLNGVIDPLNQNQLDFDENDFISSMDSLKVQAHDAGVYSYNGEPEIRSISTYQERYRVYDASTQNRLSTLDYDYSDIWQSLQSNSSDDIMEQTRSFYYDSSIDWTKNGTVKIVYSDGNSSSAFVVAPHVLATAAHCVIGDDKTHCANISKIFYFPSSSSTQQNLTPDGYTTPVQIHIPESYIYADYNNENPRDFDYALITVTDSLQSYMSYGLSVGLDSAASGNHSATIAGFPLSTNSGTNTSTIHNQISANGNITQYSTWQFLITSGCAGGISGGPAYITETFNNITYNSAFGIVVAGDDDNVLCVRITTEILRFYKHNNHLSW